MTHQTMQGPNPDNDAWFARLPLEDQQTTDLAVKRCNRALRAVEQFGLPEEYHGIAERYNSWIKRNNADRTNLGAVVSDEQVYAVDQMVSHTIYDADIFGQMMASVQQTQEVPKWQVKQYLLQDLVWPAFSRYFRNPAFVLLKQSNAWTEGIGLMLGYQMPWTEIEEAKGGLWDPLTQEMLACGTKMGVMKSRRGFLGTSCLNAVADDGTSGTNFGITGLFNYGSKLTEAVGDRTNSDDNVTSAGEVHSSIEQLLEDIKNLRAPHDKVLVTSPGIYCETLLHRDTYNRRHELMEIIEDFFGGPQPAPAALSSNFFRGTIKEWWITTDLKAATPSATNNQMMVFGRGPALMHHTVIYPQQTVPLINGKIFERDISELMLFADAVVINKADTTINCVPITTNDSDITATTAGWIGTAQRVA